MCYSLVRDMGEKRRRDSEEALRSVVILVQWNQAVMSELINKNQFLTDILKEFARDLIPEKDPIAILYSTIH